MADAASGGGGRSPITCSEYTRLPRDANGESWNPLVGCLPCTPEKQKRSGPQMVTELVVQGWDHCLTLCHWTNASQRMARRASPQPLADSSPPLAFPPSVAYFPVLLGEHGTKMVSQQLTMWTKESVRKAGCTCRKQTKWNQRRRPAPSDCDHLGLVGRSIPHVGGLLVAQLFFMSNDGLTAWCWPLNPHNC